MRNGILCGHWETEKLREERMGNLACSIDLEVTGGLKRLYGGASEKVAIGWKVRSWLTLPGNVWGSKSTADEM